MVHFIVLLREIMTDLQESLVGYATYMFSKQTLII